ncbi:MAG: amidohydrolase family protein [Bacillota bacterium]|nr:amidohydrolase family protein [Bacillota bacterium]
MIALAGSLVIDGTGALFGGKAGSSLGGTPAASFLSGGTEPLGAGSDAAVLVDGDRVTRVVDSAELDALEKQGCEVLRFPGCTVMPGYVNCHCHLVMPGDGTSVEDAMEPTDSVILLRAARNAEKALRSGVTTLADLGGRNDVTFILRHAIAEGIVPGPDLVVCGRPVTITGGHCWVFGGQADTDAEIAKLCRMLLRDGAGLLKVMGTGGGTRGTNPLQPQFTTEQLRLVAGEAHRRNRPAFVHCSTSEVATMCLDAGIDTIVHGHFNTPQGELRFSPEIADRAAHAGVYWNPTLYVNRVIVERLAASASDAEGKARYTDRAAKYQAQAQNVRQLSEHGVNLVAGSDEGWGWNAFGGFANELKAMVDAGIPAAKVIESATLKAARALRVDSTVGTFEPGKLANAVVVRGNPLEDASAFGAVEAVFLKGRRVV